MEQAQDRGLLAELANMLVQMSHEAVPGQRPKVKKAGGWHDEDRDTIHPGMVTEFLEGIVASVGSLVSSPSVTKNTREEVSWRDARHPWRRSPVWLLLRVSLQLAFKEFMPEPLDGQRVYKSFMVFMMSQILSSSKKPQMPVDTLYAMNAKIARRLNKLHNIDFALLQKIRESMNETHEEITKRWHLQQESDVRCLDLEQLCKLDFEKDSILHFPEMAEYLSTTKAPDNSGIGSDFRPINELVTYAHDDLPKGIGDEVPTHNVLFRLNAFENWIANSLKVWTESHRTEGDCAALAKLLESYSQIAIREYKGNPEATSVMVLVSIEMWISCDQIATSICPLLRDYEPGIPIEHLQNLLLPFADQERRLNLVEEYLTTRKDQSHMNDLTSQVVGDPEAFSVRYFDESAEHQKMLREISADADRAREAKLMRWRELKHEYNHLMSMHNQIPDCTYIEHVIDRRYGTTTRRHSSECSKCSYKARASGLSLDVHEWPLPSRTLDAKTVILELAPPTWLVHLRDVTADVQQSILTARYGSIHKPRSNHRLENDPHLANLRRGVINRRLGLLSEVKPHVGTHRRGKSLATASESDICVQNGLSYSYFDKHETCFVDSLIWTEDILHACTYQLPSRAASLQKFLFRPASCPQGPSPNTVIAEQFTCPDHMTIQEFKELSDIPLGTSLQWWNIAVQLKAPLVDINRPEAVLIILQCIYQVGPPPQPGLTIRGSHEMLQTSEFCWVLLDALKEALSRITHNWACVMSLRALVAIARRLLSLSSVGDVQTACFGYLAEARTVSFRWVNILHKSAQGANSDKARKDLERRVFEAAITCVSTFDLDQKYQDALLGSEYASILLQCSIIIKQRIDISDCFSGTTRFLYERYQRVLQNTCHILAANQHSLHDAVGRSCVVYQHGSKWVLADGTGNWIISHFAQSKFETRSTASLNLLTGELLINGLPLDRLPAEYRSSTRYTDLFGNSILEVVQSRTSGMAFDSKGKYYGFSLQFKMHAIPGSKSRDLIVLALNGEEDYTILPSNLLEACLPSFFVENYIHWYDNKNERVEFRPKSKPWIRDTRECWILEKCSEDSKWQLTRSKDEAVLVGSKSSTAIALSRILSPLAKPLQLHLILSPNRQFLNVELNGLSLGFSLRKGSSCLRSREYVHMYVDPNQRLGTLIGFTNKLLLTDETNANRVVIVTEGRITIKQWNFDSEHFTTSSQVHASVDLHTAYALHTFQVRPHLCNLGGNGSLESELYLAYLHAITSCCLQDPFTKKTGTERALQILCSARVASFLRLSKQSLGLLQLIGKLTPHRAYYPTNLRDMQTVEWHKNLSFLSQHPRFHTTVKSIFAQAERQRFLLPDTDLRYPELNDIHPTLQERDEIRSSMFRVCEFGAEDFTTAHDVMYPGRGLAEDSDRRLNALTVCRMILNECVKVPWKIHEDCVWRLLKQNPQRSVTGFTMELPQLRYQARFIEEAESIVAENWSKAYLLLTQQNPRPNKYAVMIWLSTLACSKIDRGVLTMLALAFTRAEFQSRAPTDEFIKISDGIDVRPHLRAIIEHHVRDFHSSPEDRQSRLPNESRKAFGHRVHNAFQTNKGQAVRILESGLAHQWPCAVPSTPKDTEPLRISDYVDKSAVIPPIREIFKSCFANLKMHEFLRHLEKLAEGISVERVNYPGRPASSITAFETVTGFISIDDLFNRPAPSVTAFDGNFSSHTQERGTANLTRLRIFLDELSESLTESEYHSRYIKTLESSFDALQQGDHTGQSSIPNMRLLDAAQTMYSEQVHSIESTLIAALSHEGDHLNRHRAVSEEIGQGPRIGPDLLLQQLSRMRWNGLGIPWRRCIIAYGVALIALRRVQRVIAFHKAGKEAEAAQDWHNVPHRNWDPYDYPETLLLEVESGITIRERQEQVAAEMRKPQGKHNASMQLNMGEGKSSVIAPIVAAALADGTCLVRIVVAKPQSKQMTQMLISKLGGLIGRRIFFLPISRSLRLDKAAANSIDQMCHECMKSGGILLVQPEHLLSFQLMVLDRYIAGETATAEILSRTQNFLDENSRDIVDEGDENFNVKFELIYTMGSQLPIDASPDRWIHIGELLDLVKTFAEQVIQSLPSSISVQYSSPGAFPYLRILRTDAGRLLEELIATKICKIGLRGFPIARQPPDVRDAVYTYITKRDITKSEARLVENPDSNSFFTETLRPKLYLLRGLIAGGVLSFVLFRKRWCVNYGLDLQRVPATRLAVPYRSKDQPSLRSDFSHPDVVILLTYLSYYYGGLTDDDMVLAFHNLMSSDQRDTEYQEWVMNVSNLSEGFRRLEGINLEDRQTLVAQVFPHLRKVKNVVDFFLNNIVFPKELRVFPEKLSASGWDIGKVKRHPTTAFSGTCDTHPLLPLSIEHLDLPHQRHTNALVLNHLLQPENQVLRLASAHVRQETDAEMILSAVLSTNPQPRVIIDVGALVLDMGNEQLARTWLERHTSDSAEAVVFFDDHDELSTIDRAGNVERLQTSPFSNRLSSCLIFLDEAHTRGTDLKLPTDYRAAVTLGPSLTKDRLIQACMRMRKLGKGQNVVFLVNDEIRAKIQECAHKYEQTDITPSDVLRWTIHETHLDIRRSMPLWAKQGRNFTRQSRIWARLKGNTVSPSTEAARFLEPEARSLEFRYRPHLPTDTDVEDPEIDHADLGLISHRLQECFSLGDVEGTLEEEQEKELSPEMQEERQLQKPPPAKPAKHTLHPDVLKFAATAVVSHTSTAYQPAFTSLNSISAAGAFDVDQLSGNGTLYATKDFIRTVEHAPGSRLCDSFLRAVQWILVPTTSECEQTVPALIISPYEAQGLLGRLREGSATSLHIFKPYWSTGLPALNQFNFFHFPPAGRPPRPSRKSLIQLNIFAGRGYFNAYQEYIDTCAFLRLAHQYSTTGLVTANDGFILKDEQDPDNVERSPRQSPVAFVQALMNIRAHHRDITKSHMGKLLGGTVVVASDVETRFPQQLCPVEESAADSRHVPYPRAVPLRQAWALSADRTSGLPILCLHLSSHRLQLPVDPLLYLERFRHGSWRHLLLTMYRAAGPCFRNPCVIKYNNATEEAIADMSGPPNISLVESTQRIVTQHPYVALDCELNSPEAIEALRLVIEGAVSSSCAFISGSHTLPPEVYPGVLGGFSTLFDKAMFSLREKSELAKTTKGNIAISEAAAALDRLGSYLFSGNAKIVGNSILRHLDTTDLLRYGDWPHIGPGC